MKQLRFLLFALLAMRITSGDSAVIYVNENGGGVPIGNSWSNPFTDLTTALSNAQAGDEIWVAAGVYKPTSGTDRDLSFQVGSDIQIYGGFNGTETARNQRNWSANTTVLSGDIGIAIVNTDNSRRLLDITGTGVIVDGFQIRGVYDEMNLSTGAIRVANIAEATIRNCIIRNNLAAGSSAATVLGVAQFENCLIHNNTNTNSSGVINGGFDATVSIVHCTFTNNTLQGASSLVGGAFVADIRVYNSILANGAGDNSQLDFIANSVLDGSVSGPALTTVNIVNGPPLFVDPSGDFRLTAESPAVNLGSISYVTTGRDLDGRPRIHNNRPDAGCYEYQERPVVFVNPDATGNGSGNTWNHAYTDLQDALANAVAGEEIWVKAGVYRPTTTNNRFASFTLSHDVPVYGGFVGGENARGQRDWNANPTFLSGNIGDQAIDTDNSYNVVVCNDPMGVFTLNGFRVIRGYADGANLVRQRGAGIRVNNANTITIVNCDIRNHFAMDEGAGMYVQNATQINVISSKVRNNEAPVSSAIYGVTIMRLESTAIMNNTNTGTAALKGVVTMGGPSVLQVVNCTVTENTFDTSSGSFLLSCYSFTEIVNSIVSGNNVDLSVAVANDVPNTTNVSYSILEGAELPTAGESVSYGPPGFRRPIEGDYRLIKTSAGFNTGNPDAVTAIRDAEGNPRVALGQVDFGAFETNEELAPVIYVNASASGTNTGNSWANAYNDLQDALASATSGYEVWVAQGVYKPTSSSDVTIAFEVPGGVTLLGGFEGTESRAVDRNWAQNETVLSGDIGVLGQSNDNSRTIIRIVNQLGETVIDGFRILGANGGSADFNATPLSVQSCELVRVLNCQFINNVAAQAAGIRALASELFVANCLFTQNTFSTQGVINVTNSGSATIEHCTFASNTTTGTVSIGAVNAGLGSSLTLTNCIMWENGTSEANNTQAGVRIARNCLYDVWVARPDDVLENNIEGEDPLFADAGAFDFRLGAGSPAANTGRFTELSDGLDLNGNVRTFGTKPDMGCFERLNRPVRFVKKDATGTGTGLTWADAYTSLITALEEAPSGVQIWITADEYRASDSLDEDAFFELPDDVHLFGGFAGNETGIRQRASSARTVIEGFLGENANGAFVRSKLLFNINGNSNGNLIDGFELRNASGDLDLALTARAVNVVQSTNVRIRNCHIHSNSSNRGSAVFFSGSTGALENCLVESNVSKSTGCIHLFDEAQLGVIHTTISNNTRITGSVKSPISGTNTSSLFMRNSIVWQNGGGLNSPNQSDVAYCLLNSITGQNGETFANNILGVDPAFQQGSYRLTAESPALDFGITGLSTVPIDLDGRPRAYGTAPDLGCYEFEDKEVVFVDQNASGFNTGRSWADAYRTLQEALEGLNDAQVWMAAGTYTPTDDDDRLAHWYLLAGTDLYGGFAGGETSIDERNWALNPTILSGNIGDAASAIDNSMLLLRVQGASVVDGVWLTEANDAPLADGSPLPFRRGAVYTDSAAALDVRNCRFESNAASAGILRIFTSAAVGSMRLENCLIRGNTVDNSALISISYDDNLEIINCTFTENTKTSTLPGAVLNAFEQLFDVDAGLKDIKNTILWNNVGFSAALSNGFNVFNSVVTSAPLDQLSENVVFADPLLTATFGLSQGSPAIDAGNDGYVNAPRDLAYAPRIQGNGVDMGCFESPFTADVTVECLGDFDGDGNIGASDLLIFLSQFGCALNCSTDLTDDDVVGAADLLVFLSLFGTSCAD